jgi:CubicO group peptidase (beta-lactamase class C family)
MALVRLLVLVLLLAGAPAWAEAAPGPADDLVGLWKAKRWFGPEARGPVILRRVGSSYLVDMAGYVVPARTERDELVFDLPNGLGRFRGKWQGGGVAGPWFPPSSAAFSMGTIYASPVRLRPDGADRWTGQVAPFDDTFTFYLLIQKQPDGSTSAIVRNPERDYGAQRGVRHAVRDGPLVKLTGGRNGPEADIAVGTYNAADKILTLAFNNRGGWSYDFIRDDDQSAFYPRGRAPQPWTYQPPPARDDGWPTGTLQEAGLDGAMLGKLVQAVVEEPMDVADARQVHAILIARHGKLVFEEYFHGENRDRLHETRSAAKSVTATLVGAAMQAGAPLRLADPVYKVMNGGAYPTGLEPRKQAVTLANLLSMTSGIYCDDNDPNAPAAEDAMWNQSEEPDFHRFFMRAPMAFEPGKTAVYCSGSPNLALGMVARATGEDPRYTFDRLLGEPLKITRYGWLQDPAGQPFGGGGVQFLPRDFMKFGQLMLNGGTWGGRRILPADFVARASSRLYPLGSMGFGYGYGWWIIDYPYKGRTLRTFAALGNGGQVVVVIPEFDMVAAAYSGNYANARLTRAFQSELLPNYILPAVR